MGTKSFWEGVDIQGEALSALVIVIAGLMILRELRVDITPALTGAGIAGLAIGFGVEFIKVALTFPANAPAQPKPAKKKGLLGRILKKDE